MYKYVNVFILVCMHFNTLYFNAQKPAMSLKESLPSKTCAEGLSIGMQT